VDERRRQHSGTADGGALTLNFTLRSRPQAAAKRLRSEKHALALLATSDAADVHMVPPLLDSRRAASSAGSSASHAIAIDVEDEVRSKLDSLRCLTARVHCRLLRALPALVR
jgi:hypothetical protein